MNNLIDIIVYKNYTFFNILTSKNLPYITNIFMFLFSLNPLYKI